MLKFFLPRTAGTENIFLAPPRALYCGMLAGLCQSGVRRVMLRTMLFFCTLYRRHSTRKSNNSWLCVWLCVVLCGFVWLCVFLCDFFNSASLKFTHKYLSAVVWLASCECVPEWNLKFLPFSSHQTNTTRCEHAKHVGMNAQCLGTNYTVKYAFWWSRTWESTMLRKLLFQ